MEVNWRPDLVGKPTIYHLIRAGLLQPNPAEEGDPASSSTAMDSQGRLIVEDPVTRELSAIDWNNPAYDEEGALKPVPYDPVAELGITPEQLTSFIQEDQYNLANMRLEPGGGGSFGTWWEGMKEGGLPMLAVMAAGTNGFGLMGGGTAAAGAGAGATGTATSAEMAAALAADATAYTPASLAGVAAAEGLPLAGAASTLAPVVDRSFTTGTLPPGATPGVGGIPLLGLGAAAAGAATGGAGATGALGLGASAAGSLIPGISNSLLGAGAGALLGGLGGSEQAGTTTTVQDVPDWLRPYVQNNLNAAQAQMPTGPNPLIQQGQNEMSRTIGGSYLSPFSNPYLMDTYNQAAKAVSDSYLSTTQPKTDFMFGRTGNAFGDNSGYQETVARNQFGFGQNLNNLATDIFGANYQKERERQFGAANAAPTFAGQSTQANFAPFNAMTDLFPNVRQQSQPYFQNQGASMLGGALLGSQLFR